MDLDLLSSTSSLLIVMSNNANSSANSSPAKTFAMVNQPNSANASPQMVKFHNLNSFRFAIRQPIN